ncbi:MAG: hypothetical protein WAX77_00745 [Methylococcaceae bacterium]
MRIKIILLSITLTACSLGKHEDKRYLDTSALEQPPKRVIEPSSVRDISSVPALALRRGLGSNIVSWLETEPPAVLLKQSPAESWHTLEQALRQCTLKIIDRERDKGRYYVLYKQEHLFERKAEASTYMIALNQSNTDTKISVSLVHEFEQSSNHLSPPHNDSETLLKSLYDMLRNNLTAE